MADHPAPLKPHGCGAMDGVYRIAKSFFNAIEVTLWYLMTGYLPLYFR
jgi:hypothetical protein